MGDRMIFFRRLFFTAVLAALPVGCVTAGHEFKPETAWVKNGTTSQKDIQFMLGEPYAVGQSDGEKTWTYGYYKYYLIGKPKTKELKFYFNNDKTVNRYTYNSTFPGDVAAQTSP